MRGRMLTEVFRLYEGKHRELKRVDASIREEEMNLELLKKRRENLSEEIKVACKEFNFEQDEDGKLIPSKVVFNELKLEHEALKRGEVY